MQKPYGRQIFKETYPNWRRNAPLALDDEHRSVVKPDDCNPVSAEVEYPVPKSFNFVEKLVTSTTHGKGWRETTVCKEVIENEGTTLSRDRVPDSTIHNNADFSNSENTNTKTRLPLFATDDDIDDIINDL